MSNPIDRTVDALTGCCSHCDDMAWGKADDLHAAGLLVTPAHDAAVAAKALREAADLLADMTEGHERIGTSEWSSEAARDAYSLAIEEASSALRSMAVECEGGGDE